MPVTPELSLVVPVFRGADFIGASVGVLLDVLARTTGGFELIVVSDGDGPDTVERAAAAAHPALTVVDIPVNQGKGRAVITGMSYSTGRFVGFFDADLDIDPSVIPAALEVLRSGEWDAVVGSKRHPDSDVHYSRSRRVYSWGFQQLVSMMFRVGARDTQVGAKFFTRELVDAVAADLAVDGYAFDIEFLAVAARRGYGRVTEVPVTIGERFRGSGITSAAAWRMFRDTVEVAWRMHIQHGYEAPEGRREPPDHVVRLMAESGTVLEGNHR